MAIIGDTLFEPLQPEIPMPQQPQLMEERKSLWRDYLEKLKDPNVKQAMLQTGLGLLRSPKYGERRGDIIADSLQAGAFTLHGLREADRARARQDAEIARQQRNAEVEQKQRGEQIEIQRSQAGTQATAVGANIENAKAEMDKANRALDEAIRHNKASEEIDRLRAAADMKRANFYAISGGKSTPQDLIKIDYLTRKYVAEGLDEVTARDRATRDLEMSRGKTKEDTARELFIKSMENPFNYKLLQTEEGRQQLLDRALRDAEMVHGANQPVTRPYAPGATQPGPYASTAPGAPPASAVAGAPATGGSPIGATVQDSKGQTWRKVKQGPDRDQNNWELVSAGVAR